MSDPVDHFVKIPLRFVDARIADEIDQLHFPIGVHVAARCYEVVNTAGGVAAIRLSGLAELCGVSNDTVSRKLHDLRERGWIDFEKPNPGQHVAWRIWVTGLAHNGQFGAGSAPAPRQLRRNPPAVRSLSSGGPPAEDAAILHGDGHRSSAPARQADASSPTDETRRDETRSLTEENYNHPVGKTTGEVPELERAFLADRQALVDAGEARWR